MKESPNQDLTTINTHPIRAGFMIPAGNTVAEADFHAMAPLGVTVHTTRMWLKIKRQEELEEPIKLLARAKMDVIAYACTEGSFEGTPDHHYELIRMIEKIGGAKATTTSTSVIQALRTLESRKVSVLTPYTEEVNKVLRSFLEYNGLDVVALERMNENLDQSELSLAAPSQISQAVAGVNRTSSDTIFVSCANLPVTKYIRDIEKLVGKPVITSNQATMWGVLRLIGRGSVPVPSFGRLLEEPHR